jgi:hypothetical protein
MTTSSDAPADPDPLEGLTGARCASLERVPIRTREDSVTRSGWRMSVACGEGPGTIVLLELSPSVSLCRGEGVFLGWSADRLEAAYRVLRPPPGEPDTDFNQLG